MSAGTEEGSRRHVRCFLGALPPVDLRAVCCEVTRQYMHDYGSEKSRCRGKGRVMSGGVMRPGGLRDG